MVQRQHGIARDTRHQVELLIAFSSRFTISMLRESFVFFAGCWKQAREARRFLANGSLRGFESRELFNVPPIDGLAKS